MLNRRKDNSVFYLFIWGLLNSKLIKAFATELPFPYVWVDLKPI